MLYQAGYFTIKEKNDDDYFEVGLPNLEVKKAYGDVLIQLLSRNVAKIEQERKVFVDSFNGCDIPRLQEICSAMVNNLSYDGIRAFNEASYRDVFRIYLTCWGLQPATEVISAFGRADLVVSTDKYLYVIEMKLVHRKVDITKKLEEAKKQIITRQYDVRLTTKK